MTRNDADKAQAAAPGASRAQRTSEPSLDTVAIRGREEIAQTIYERTFNPPMPWVPGGNSLKQDEARAVADAILSLPALSKAQARVSLLEGVLEKARDTFRHYGDLHRDKGTSEGHQKAAVNYALAMEMDEALSEATLVDELGSRPQDVVAPVCASAGGSASASEDR